MNRLGIWRRLPESRWIFGGDFPHAIPRLHTTLPKHLPTPKPMPMFSKKAQGCAEGTGDVHFAVLVFYKKEKRI